MLLIDLIIFLAIIAAGVAFLSKAGILKSQKNKLDKAARDLNEKTRDPIADAEAAIHAARDSVRKLKEIRIAERTRLAKFERLLEVNISHINKWENLAKAAGENKNVDDVRKCLTHKAAYEKQKAEIATSITAAEESISVLAAKITSLEEKISHAGEHKQTLELRKEKADIDAEIAERTNNIDTDSLDGAFAQLEEDTLNSEARTDALLAEAAAQTPAAENLEAKYSPGKPEVSDEQVKAYLKV